MDAFLIHHIVIVLLFLGFISSLNRSHSFFYFLSLIYLYLVHERYVMRLKRQLQFEERKQANQRRVLQGKTDEAAMATKRLKELLESRKSSVTANGLSPTRQVNEKNLQKWLDNELEVMTKVHQVRFQYEKQIQVQAALAEELTSLKREMDFASGPHQEKNGKLRISNHGTITCISFDDQASLPLKEHDLTTEEVKILCNDLGVLGKNDFKHILKWRLQIRKALTRERKEVAKKEPDVAKEDKENEDDRLLNELEELTNAVDRKKKHAKKLLAK